MAKDAVQNSDNAYWAACMERVAAERDQSSFMVLYDHFSPRVNAYLQGQGVDAATAEGETLTVTCDADRRAPVVAALVDAGLQIADFETVQPSLEDAFVRLVAESEEAGAR
jgi:ABC-type uncharacterized transport system ATPase subunit